MKDGNQEHSMSINSLIEHFGVGNYQIRYMVVMSILEGSDGIELLMMSLLGQLLRCEWHISSLEVALTTSIVFAGSIFGAPILGNLADRYGRKSVLLLACVLSLYFVTLSSLAPSLFWFYLTRFVFGFGIAGNLSNLSTILSEVSPTYFRAKIQALTFVSWSLGSFIVIGIAYFVVPTLGWRWFIIFGSAPLLVGTIAVLFMDESIRFLLVTGQTEKALKVIEKFSHANRVALPGCPIDLGTVTTPNSSGNYLQIFSRKYRFLTILQMLSWFIAGSIYYGAVMLSTNMPTISYPCLQSSSKLFQSKGENADCCTVFDSNYYIQLSIATIGDFVGCVIDAFVLDWIGRRKALSLFAAVAAGGFIGLDFCMPVILRSICFLIVRCSALSLLNGWFIFSLELYPTTIRSSGFGTCQISNRIGQVVTPFIAVVLLRDNTRLTLFLYAALAVIGMILALCIPVETNNKPLEDNSFDVGEEVYPDKNRTYGSIEFSGKKR